mmetsp:Transcript_16371/g.51223  ORF Transcript_16371/g.51223 Transcript_16371/m.51223 type:complete len:315 (-) Transcript_16371:70-1014(-)
MSFPCAACSSVYTSRADLDHHVALRHPFRCSDCRKIYPSKLDLDTHMAKRHGGGGSLGSSGHTPSPALTPREPSRPAPQRRTTSDQPTQGYREIPDFKDAASSSPGNSGYGAVPQFRDATRPAGTPPASSPPTSAAVPSASPAYGGVPGKDKIGSFARFGGGGGAQAPTPGYQSIFGGNAAPATAGSPASSTTSSVPSNGYGVIPESGGTSAPAVATPGYGVIPTSAAGAAAVGRARPLSTMSPEAAGYGNLPLPSGMAQAGKQGGYGSVPGEPEGTASHGSGIAPGGARYGAVPTGNAKPKTTGGYGAVPGGR